MELEVVETTFDLVSRECTKYRGVVGSEWPKRQLQEGSTSPRGAPTEETRWTRKRC